MKDEFGKDRFEGIKPANALGTLAERSRGSRTIYVLVAIVVLFVLAFVIGLVVKSVRGGLNTPDIPKVETR